MSSLNTMEMVGISVPVKANTLVKLVEVLATGVATSDKKDELLEVIEAAQIIGIDLNGYVLNETGVLSTTVEETVCKVFNYARQSLEESLENCDGEETNEEGEIVDDWENKLPSKKRGRPRGSLTEIPTFKCNDCEINFKKKGDLKKHVCRNSKH